METRIANITDTQQIRSLWSYCFYDSEHYIDWFFNNVYKSENTIVTTIECKVVSAAQLLPYTVWLHNTEVLAYYIMGVSSYPEVRGKGGVSAIMKLAAEVAGLRGAVINLLNPAIDSFYERYGYVSCYNFAEYVLSPNNSPMDFKGSYYKCALADMPTLNHIYNGFTRGYNGYTHRSNENWQNIMQSLNILNGFCYIMADEKNNPCGYILYTIDAQKLRVLEAAYSSVQGIMGILQFIGTHGTQTKRAFLRMPSDDPINKLLYKNHINIRLMPTTMAQTVNKDAAIELLNKAYNRDFSALSELEITAFTRLFMGQELASLQAAGLIPSGYEQFGDIFTGKKNYINLLG